MGKGSGSAKADVTEYRMSIHLGVALELDSVNKVTVDEKVAWQGLADTSQAVTINQPEAYGGEKKEGGLVGTLQILLGRANQTLPAMVAARYGKTPSTAPAFRHRTTLMFLGLNGNGGFTWKHNSAIIAQNIDVEGSRAPRTDLDPQWKAIPNPDQPTMPDANPAYMIYELLTDDEFGMGGSPDSLDPTSFESSGETLFNEAFGLTILWMRQSSVESLVNEILDHIQGTLFADPTTGLMTLKLLRDDYGDPDDLFEINTDNAKLSKYKQRSGGEIVNELTVNWTNPINEQSESITYQDIASIQSQGGKVSGSRDYYGVRYAELARKLLARDLRASTAPLISCEAVINRSAWNKRPGDVVVVSWPKRNIYRMVMRVGKVNYGSPLSSSVRVSLLQDVFSLSRPPLIIDPGTGWVNPSADPQPLTMQITTLPAFFSRNATLQRVPVLLGEDEVLAMSLADSQDPDSFDYELVSETPGVDGVDAITSKGTMSMTPLALLAVPLAAETVSELPFALFPDAAWQPIVGAFIWLGTTDVNQEVVLVTGTTVTGWTIDRGLLDTVPRAWDAATPVWAVNPGSRIVDVQTIHAAGETVTYRGLDRTSVGTLEYADAPDETATLTNRPHLPLRPADVTVHGAAFGSVAIGGSASFTIEWATRNREMEDSQVLLWTDGPILPEYRQETVVRAYDVATNDLVLEYGYLWLDNDITFPKIDFDRYASVRFEIWSRRDDLWSLAGHSVIVTGFAGNPAAPIPPAPPARTTPPPPVAAPGVSVFVSAASTDTGSGGTQVPTILISGQQDNPAATGLVARYRQAGAIDWSVLPPVALNNEAVQFEISGVQPGTNYEVGVAYVVGVVGQYRDLDDVLTNDIVSGDVIPIVPGSVTGTPAISITTTIAPDGTQTSRLFGSWTAPSAALTYVVEIDDGAIVQQIPVTENAIDNHIVATGPTYRYRVKAMSRTGTLSASWSAWSANATAGGDTTPPGDITGPAVVEMARRLVWSWVVPVDDDYAHLQIYRNTSGVVPGGGTTPTFPEVTGSIWADNNVLAGTEYHYWGRTVDRSGNVAGWVSMGSGTPSYVSVFGGDVDGGDVVLVTELGRSMDVLPSAPVRLESISASARQALQSFETSIAEQARRHAAGINTHEMIGHIAVVDPVGGSVDMRETAGRILVGQDTLGESVQRVNKGLGAEGEIQVQVPRDVSELSGIYNEQIEITAEGELVINNPGGPVIGGQVLRVQEATGFLGHDAFIRRSTVDANQGGRYFLEKPLIDTTLTGDLALDIYQSALRIFDATTLYGVTLPFTAFQPSIGGRIVVSTPAGVVTGDVASTTALRAPYARIGNDPGDGFVALVEGDATYTGRMEFYSGAAARLGYVGFGHNGDTLLMAADTGVTWAFDKQLRMLAGATVTGLLTADSLDVYSGGIGLVLGADNGASTRTNVTAKYGRLAFPHYTNAEEPFAGLVAASDGSNNTLSIGGGSGALNSASILAFFTGANATTLTGTERMRINSAGNVGLGTTTPNNKLDVVGGNNDGLQYRTSTRTVGIGMIAGENAVYWGSGTSLNFTSGGGIPLSISTGGLVGIGTTSPATKLDIVGTNASQLRISNTTVDTTIKNGYIQGRHYTNAEEDFLGVLMTSGPSANDISFGGSSTVLNAATGIHFYTAGTNTTLTGTERMTINSAGNVGIGTTSPDGRLHIHRATAGAVTANANGDELVLESNGTTGMSFLSPNTATQYILFGDADDNDIGDIRYNHTDNSLRLTANAGTGYIHLTSAGKVGVGTATPGAQFHVRANTAGAATDNLFLSNSGTTDGSGTALHMGFADSAGAGYYGVRILQTGYPSTTRSSDLAFQIHGSTNNTTDWKTALFIQRTTANVGIGTTAPDTKLHVAGPIKLAGSLVRTGADQTFAVDAGRGFHWSVNGTDVALLEANGRLSVNLLSIGGANFDPATKVATTGNETIAGVKTFSSTPVAPGLATVGADMHLKVGTGQGFYFDVNGVATALLQADGRLSLNAITMGGLGLGEWTDWTPTPVAESGTATGLAMVYAEVERHGKSVTVNFAVSQTAIDTATAAILVPLPYAAKSSRNYFGSGKNFNTGADLRVEAVGSNLRITAANSYPMGSGAESLAGSITYQCA